MRLALTLLTFVVLGACSSDPQPVTATPKGSSSGSSTGSASFEKDVMPIIGESCALTACHGASQSNLGIHLTFDKAQVYAEFQKGSPTFPGVKFVVPGKPEDSLVMGKMDGTQAKTTGCSNGCGKEMPPDALLTQEQRDVVRTWIENGAKND